MLLTTLTSTAQDITGKWNGILKIQGTQLRVVFNVEQTEDGYSSTMDSPDQGQKDIPVTKTTLEKSKIKFELTNAGIEYAGEISGDKIIGTFKQSAQEFPMNLSRKAVEKDVVRRPQEPIKPYPYYSEDVVFKNKKAKISLAGTLTLPKKDGVFPAVILITGSGPQNRDEELLGHKPFLIISDYLTRNGIAVLRYDDRGVGQSTGDFKAATSADLATDVKSAVAYLKKRKEINKKKIGLIGHSEGGLIAPIVASKSKRVSFIVLLAGTGMRGDELLLLREELILRADSDSEEDLKESIQTSSELFELVANSNGDNSKLKMDLTDKLNEAFANEPDAEIPGGMKKEEYVSLYVNQLASPWMSYFMKFNPVPSLERVRCPVLALNGAKDVQVPSKENLSAIKNALTRGGNLNVTTKEYSNLNHLFQDCETGMPDEYSTIEQTFSSIVLDDITTWIKTQTK